MMKTLPAILVLCLLLPIGLASEKKNRGVKESIENIMEELSEFKIETEERFEAIEETIANDTGILIYLRRVNAKYDELPYLTF